MLHTNRQKVVPIDVISVMDIDSNRFERERNLKKWKTKSYLHHATLYKFRKGVLEPRQKNIRDVHLNRAPALQIIKNGLTNFETIILTWTIDPALWTTWILMMTLYIRDLMKNNPRITTEEIADRLNSHTPSAFRHLKKLGFTSKLDT